MVTAFEPNGLIFCLVFRYELCQHRDIQLKEMFCLRSFQKGLYGIGAVAMNENASFMPESNEEWGPSPQPSPLLSSLVCWGVALAVIGIAVAMLLPDPRSPRPAAYRTVCKNNLKQIGLALHNYHDTYGAFPPAYTVDSEGKPLHSWRVLILPFLEQQALYDQIDLTKPWDDPVNEQVRQTVVPGYRCAIQTGPETHTCYLAIVGEDYALSPTKSREIFEITNKDGTANTVMVFEAPKNKTVEWMSPDEGEPDLFLKFDKTTPTYHKGGGHAMTVDGTVRFMSNELSQETRRALMTIAGNEEVEDF